MPTKESTVAASGVDGEGGPREVASVLRRKTCPLPSGTVQKASARDPFLGNSSVSETGLGVGQCSEGLRSCQFHLLGFGDSESGAERERALQKAVDAQRCGRATEAEGWSCAFLNKEGGRGGSGERARGLGSRSWGLGLQVMEGFLSLSSFIRQIVCLVQK